MSFIYIASIATFLSLGDISSFYNTTSNQCHISVRGTVQGYSGFKLEGDCQEYFKNNTIFIEGIKQEYKKKPTK